MLPKFVCIVDAYTVDDVVYNWKTKGPNAIEVFATELAQYDLLDVVTSKKASTNSKGKIIQCSCVKVDLNFSGKCLGFLIHWTYKHEQVRVQARIVLRIMWIQTP